MLYILWHLLQFHLHASVSYAIINAIIHTCDFPAVKCQAEKD